MQGCSNKEMFEKIIEDIKESSQNWKSSFDPTREEIYICWSIIKITKLQKEIIKLKEEIKKLKEKC